MFSTNSYSIKHSTTEVLNSLLVVVQSSTTADPLKLSRGPPVVRESPVGNHCLDS